MQPSREPIRDLSELRNYVSRILCQRNDIEVGVFQISERVLTRRGKPCGIFFCLHGPRSVKLTAIFETDKNCVLFYGSSGEKFQKTKLTQTPTLVARQS